MKSEDTFDAASCCDKNPDKIDIISFTGRLTAWEEGAEQLRHHNHTRVFYQNI